MSDDPRLEALLDKLLVSQTTPEQVCASYPELLPDVRRRWHEIKRVRAELDLLFPPSTWAKEHRPTLPFEDTPLPTLPGYEVQAVLGRGGVGVVYKALHLRLNRPVAVKMLLSGQHASPEELERFLREAEAVAGLHHPNVVNLYDAGEVEGRPYFTMEFVEGGNFARKLAEGPMPARKAAALVAQVADAIERAHQSGIIHRDLKPGNVLLTPDGTPKVTDFGLARLESDTGLTLSGAPVGTPSYMAPEQARGEKSAIGPATDVYALGAILYECLTGRPPFRAETSTATLQQVLVEEPVRPAQLNPRIPRDAETICLKCLEKDPQRRYTSAAALADDLYRFERGDPIKARPIGHLARALRWARRRPALAAALASGVLLASALVFTFLWWHGQRTAQEASAVAYTEADLNESAQLRDRGEFEAAAAVLQRDKDRLGGYVPPELRDRLREAFDNLELVARLDAIRLERALIKPPAEVLDVLDVPATAASRGDNGLTDETVRGSREMMSGTMIPQDNNDLPDEAPSARQYEEVFRYAGIGAPGDDPSEAAARIRTSPVNKALVSALDDWSACAVSREKQAWILAVARQADPDPWRDRVRDPATWDNAEALRDLAARASVREQSPQLLAVLGARLLAKKIDAVPFLARVSAACPNDFWANIETGNALLNRSNAADAAGYYRAALALRPGTVSIHYALGGMYLGLYRWDQCIAEYEQAIRLDPGNAWCHNRLGVAFQWKGSHEDEAITQFRKSIRIDPNIGWTHHHLAVSLERKGRFDEAIMEFDEAARLFPEKRFEWKRDVRRVLMRQGRRPEALAAWKEQLAGRPASYDEWYGYAELCLFLGDEAEYRRARRELLAQFSTTTDPVVAERAGRGCLLLPGAEDELRQASALTDLAVAAEGPQFDSFRPYFHFAKGLAHYRRGKHNDVIATMTGDASKAAEYLGPSPRLVTAMALYQEGKQDEARKLLAAAVHSYDWSADNATKIEAWIAHILRREAESLILRDVPASLDDK